MNFKEYLETLDESSKKLKWVVTYKGDSVQVDAFTEPQAIKYGLKKMNIKIPKGTGPFNPLSAKAIVLGK